MTPAGVAGAAASRAARLVWVALALILALAAQLRLQATLHTEVDLPIRSDAADYFWYAFNLKEYGVYSREPPAERSTAPAPDALRSPGYPLFLASLMEHPPTRASLVRVPMAQALLGILVTFLAFAAARRVLGDRWALLVAALTAVSPHLVNAGIYFLTETLYSLTLAVALLLFTARDLERRWPWLLAAGLVLGVSALVRPTSSYLPLALLPIFFLRWPARAAWRPAAALLAGFLVVQAPWAWRNAHVPDGGAQQLKINQLHHGVYPDFTYEGVPESFGFPYRADPRSAEISASMESVTREIARRFAEEPVRHLRWYLLGKPVALWSWNEVQGMGDAFVYPVLRSPYFESGLFRATHAVAYYLHWPAVALGALFCIAIWVPRVQRLLPAPAVLPAQVCAGMLMYATALHMLGFPLPRYVVPFRPELYVAAAGALCLAGRWLRNRSRAEAVAP